MASTLELYLLAQANGRPQLISSNTIASTTASVTVSTPNSAFNAFHVVWQARSDTASTATYMVLQFNGDAGSNYAWQINQANNATAGPGNSGGNTTQIQIGAMPAASAGANFFGCGDFMITNPGSTAGFKVASGQATAMVTNTNAYSGTYGGLWGNTSAITSITFKPLAGNFVAGSLIAVYGV